MELKAISGTLRKYLDADAAEAFLRAIVQQDFFDASLALRDGRDEKIAAVFGGASTRVGVFHLLNPFQSRMFPSWLDHETIGMAAEAALEAIISRKAADVLMRHSGGVLSNQLPSETYTALWDDFYGEMDMLHTFLDLFMTQKVPNLGSDFVKRMWLDAAQTMVEILFQYSGFALAKDAPREKIFSDLLLVVPYCLPVWESNSHKIICISK